MKMKLNKFIQNFENRQIVQLMRDQDILQSLRTGDLVEANFRIHEGSKERIQRMRGYIMEKRNRALGSSIRIMGLLKTTGVEFKLPIYSKSLISVNVLKKNKVRKSKLFYLRELKGKALNLNK